MSDQRTNYVYRLFDADDALLYVGCSMDPEGRLRWHTDWWLSKAPYALEMSRRIARMEVSGPIRGREEALDAEREAIIAERPVFNVQHNRESRETSAAMRVSSKRLRAIAVRDTS